MFTQTEKRGDYANRPEGRVRRSDRRATIARKNAFLIDGLTVKAL